MLSTFSKFFVVALLLTLIPRQVFAEEIVRPGTPVPNPRGFPHPHPPHPLIRSSGYIFAGTVKSVERIAPKENGVATVLVNFHVDDGIRGVLTGQMLAIREWAGLWESGERYRPGERVLLFLYPPSKLGLTSPVGGPTGRFKIGPDGRLIFDPGGPVFPAPPPSVRGRLRGPTRISPREFVRSIRSPEEE
jgi:hypothetical protein